MILRVTQDKLLDSELLGGASYSRSNEFVAFKLAFKVRFLLTCGVSRQRAQTAFLHEDAGLQRLLLPASSKVSLDTSSTEPDGC